MLRILFGSWSLVYHCLYCFASVKLERVREGQRSQSTLLSFYRLLEPPIGESAAHSDENICRFYLEKRVRPKQPIVKNEPSLLLPAFLDRYSELYSTIKRQVASQRSSGQEGDQQPEEQPTTSPSEQIGSGPPMSVL